MSGLGPEASAIRTDAELEAAINGAQTQAELMTLLHEAAIRQHLVTPDNDPNILNATPLADNAPQKFAQTLVVGGGKRVIIEADSPESLALQVASAKRVAEELSKSPKADVTPRDSAGRFAPAPTPDADEASVAARAELEIKFKRGEISTDEYLAQSGAVEKRLRDIGVDVNELQQRSWQNATNEFLARHPEWAGGDDAKRAMADAVVSLGLEGQPSVATLEKAYNRLLSTQSLPENPELRRQREFEAELANCNNSAEIHQVSARYYGTYGSSL